MALGELTERVEMGRVRVVLIAMGIALALLGHDEYRASRLATAEPQAVELAELEAGRGLLLLEPHRSPASRRRGLAMSIGGALLVVLGAGWMWMARE